jgi:PKHD-type hydroxylase
MHKFPNILPTKYNEEYFRQPYFLWQKCANEEMVQKFIEVGESLNQMDARVGGGLNEAKVSEQVRVSKLSWIHNNEQSKEIFDFLIDKIDRINFWHYGMVLHGMESIQYTRYPIGGHYKFHNDIIYKKENDMRKLSIVLSLSPSSAYQGGELLLSPQGENPTVIKFEQGDLVAFPSYIPHKVNPVTSGHRITAVTWVYGPKFV